MPVTGSKLLSAPFAFAFFGASLVGTSRRSERTGTKRQGHVHDMIILCGV